ncbi:MAG: hypothetical protein H0Z40_08155 [Desulfotomaculum sp.]|nr:hypothetical protein [Desulfotomaculum sp.]
MSQAFFTGAAAAGISWFINGKLLKIYKNKAVIYFGPAVEEVLKSGLPVLLDASIFLTHASFGFVEAVWEFKTYGSTKLAPLGAAFSHIFLGFAAQVIFNNLGILPAVAAASGIHILWNFFIMHKLK